MVVAAVAQLGTLDKEPAARAVALAAAADDWPAVKPFSPRTVRLAVTHSEKAHGHTPQRAADTVAVAAVVDAGFMAAHMPVARAAQVVARLVLAQLRTALMRQPTWEAAAVAQAAPMSRARLTTTAAAAAAAS